MDHVTSSRTHTNRFCKFQVVWKKEIGVLQGPSGCALDYSVNRKNKTKQSYLNQILVTVSLRFPQATGKDIAKLLRAARAPPVSRMFLNGDSKGRYSTTDNLSASQQMLCS